MGRNYSSTAGEYALTGSINDVVTEFGIGPGTTGLPPVPFTLILDEGDLEEAVEVTAVAGTTLTVIRGIDGTAAQAHTAGARVLHGWTARDLQEPQDHIAAATNVHGLSGGASVVGTTSSQTLTNKTIDGDENTIRDLGTSALKDGAVTSVKIADGTIVTGDLADNAVTKAKMADNAVGTAELENGAVTSAKIADGTIVAGDLATNSVTETKLADNSVTSRTIKRSASTTSGYTQDSAWPVDSFYGVDLGNGMAYIRINFHRSGSEITPPNNGNIGNDVIGTIPVSLRGKQNQLFPLSMVANTRGVFGAVNPSTGEVTIAAVVGVTPISNGDLLELGGIYPLV